MAELQFFATADDHAAVVSLLVDRYRARFVQDGVRQSDLPSFSTVKEVIDVIEGAAEDPRFFVLCPDWQIEDLSVSETRHTDGRVRYYVRQRIGGPAFDYLARRPRQLESGVEIISSWLADYPTYYSADRTKPALRRPDAMAAAFKAIQKHMIRHGTRTEVIEIGKPGPRALNGAIAAYEVGAWLRVGDWHHEPRRLVRQSKRSRSASA